MKELVEAVREWGFFQVVNHGVPRKVLKRMLSEQREVFHQPFNKKAKDKFLNLPAKSYHWGNPNAACLSQFSWSEAFHIPLTDISRIKDYKTLRYFLHLYLHCLYFVIHTKV
ncbi:hypothetical protein Tsubulata_005465 [Turnera subulata]|uniref:Non-haem dioxygenase N-terminal domain-containing protein n=1 Tax=Turnera subulata TaxID=218843 RepID=A0A9Q0JDE2_9ROSI|nr:hypothetical protein Tsubulata_005465 [Turnera subulata]